MSCSAALSSANLSPVASIADLRARRDRLHATITVSIPESPLARLRALRWAHGDLIAEREFARRAALPGFAMADAMARVQRMVIEIILDEIRAERAK